jgi:hypothetical protein
LSFFQIRHQALKHQGTMSNSRASTSWKEEDEEQDGSIIEDHEVRETGNSSSSVESLLCGDNSPPQRYQAEENTPSRRYQVYRESLVATIAGQKEQKLKNAPRLSLAQENVVFFL